MGLLGLFDTKKSIQESGCLSGKTDRHSHILYGVDDGVKNAQEALSILSYQESIGIKEVWCTPHIMENIPNTTTALKERFEELCKIYNGPVKLHLAAEYMLDTIFEERLENKDFLTMEDNTILVETSTIVPPYDLKGMIRGAMSEGYNVLFAHPERCRFLEIKDCEELCNMGIKLQLNIASLVGFYGKNTKSKGEILLKKGLYSAFGSDCHRERVIKNQYNTAVLKKEIIQRICQL